MRILLVLLILVLGYLPSPANAQYNIDPNYGYADVINVVGATTTQSSAVFDVPAGTRGIVIRLELTAGTTPSLDIALQGLWPSDGEFETSRACVQGIVALGEHVCYIGDLIPTAAFFPSATTAKAFVGSLGRKMRVQVVAGNANAMTYHVDALFIR